MRPLLLFVFAVFSLALSAQENPVYWFTDLSAAQAYTTEHDVPILIVFAGSDWCRPCIQFKQDILETETFKAYAQTHLAVLYLDFPARRKNKLPAAQTQHNEELAEQYNRQGAFPKIVLIDQLGQSLVAPAFTGQSADVFIKELALNDE